jgi:hypothetical protein
MVCPPLLFRFLLCETEQHPKPNLSYLACPLCETEQHPNLT